MDATVFDLPGSLSAKAAPRLVAADEEHFAAVAATLEAALTDLGRRIDAALHETVRIGREAMDRDEEVERLRRRKRTLSRFGLEACLGRTVAQDGTTVYVGRLGLTDPEGRRLLVDWRSPGAEPFFAATHADPMGIVSRRRYRWSDGRVRDYWDEVLVPGPVPDGVSPDDDSAFIASLGADRSDRMRDVLATISADQDAVIRAGSRGALVVDGGPGTGKTVVALHRTAYLLYSDPRLGHRRGGVLFVGPHRPYLAYVSDVLPSLGEEGVQACTVRDLVAEGEGAPDEADAEVARLKSSLAMVDAIEQAARFYEEPPTEPLTVSTPWDDVTLTAANWAAAFASPDAGTPHNEAREQVWEALLEILVARHAGGVPEEQRRRQLAADDGLRSAFNLAWPLLDATDVVGDLWSVPAFLRRCAPGLGPDDVRRLQRSDAQAWTVADLPLLDAARHRLGERGATGLASRRGSAEAAERAAMDLVVAELLQADEEGLFAQLRQPGIRDALVDEAALPTAGADLLAGPFAHVVVDEAQELTDAEWKMLLRRCPSRSITVVGDRAQARHGFTESWAQRLERVGLDRVQVATLRVNYRTPSEVMDAAEPVIRAAIPDANVPTSIRSTGVPVEHGRLDGLPELIAAWEAENPAGVACVVGLPAFRPTARVGSLPPELVKGLEFDLVVLVDPDSFGEGVQGAVDRYVAMTRATQRLVVLRRD